MKIASTSSSGRQRVLGLRPALRAHLDHFAGAQGGEHGAVDLDHLRAQGRGARDHRDPRLGSPASATNARSTFRRRSLASAPPMAKIARGGAAGSGMRARIRAPRGRVPSKRGRFLGTPQRRWSAKPADRGSQRLTGPGADAAELACATVGLENRDAGSVMTKGGITEGQQACRPLGRGPLPGAVAGGQQRSDRQIGRRPAATSSRLERCGGGDDHLVQRPLGVVGAGRSQRQARRRRPATVRLSPAASAPGLARQSWRPLPRRAPTPRS